MCNMWPCGLVGGWVQQNNDENGGGEDKVIEEQETGGCEADEKRHCHAPRVWPGCHCSYQGGFLSLYLF